MKFPVWRLWAIGLPLFSLLCSCFLIGHQINRRNHFALELKTTETEYQRLSQDLKKNPSVASAMLSSPHTHSHSDGEEEEEHEEEEHLHK